MGKEGGRWNGKTEGGRGGRMAISVLKVYNLLGEIKCCELKMDKWRRKCYT